MSSQEYDQLYQYLKVIMKEIGILRQETNTRFDSLENEARKTRSELQDVKAEVQGVKAELQGVKAELQDVRAEI